MKNLVLLDLDGTLYVDNQALPGAAHCLALLRQKYRLAFLTNTTTQNAASIAHKLLTMGIEIEADELFTPVQASLHYLTTWEHNHGRKARVWPLVDEALNNDFAQGIFDATTPDVVILGDIG
ncbi:MAG: TIGR01458 family HAD-type hydrolase, partial [Moraxellaceae bacterium]